MSENLPKFLKKSLFFRARLVVESFLLILRTIKTYFELNIFHNKLNGNVFGRLYSSFHSNSITDVFMRVFWNSCSKNFENFPEKVCWNFLLINFYNCSLQTTWLETSLQILFWKCLGRKECSKILEISKRSFCKTIPFSLTLLACSSEFLASTKSGFKKNVSGDCSVK